MKTITIDNFNDMQNINYSDTIINVRLSTNDLANVLNTKQIRHIKLNVYQDELFNKINLILSDENLQSLCFDGHYATTNEFYDILNHIAINSKINSLTFSNVAIKLPTIQLLVKNNYIISLTLNDTGINHICAKELAKSKTIKYLKITGNECPYICKDGATALLNNPNLLELELIKCSIADEDPYNLAFEEAIIKNKTLLKLNLSYNMMTKGIMTALSQNETIETIILNNCRLLQSYIKLLEGNIKISTLDIRNFIYTSRFDDTICVVFGNVYNYEIEHGIIGYNDNTTKPLLIQEKINGPEIKNLIDYDRNNFMWVSKVDNIKVKYDDMKNILTLYISKDVVNNIVIEYIRSINNIDILSGLIYY